MKIAIAVWGVGGVVFLVAKAVVQLTPVALEIFEPGALSRGSWAVLVTWVCFNAYAEGYVGFHRKFSPRVVERALDLGEHPSFFRVLLAAPYSMGLFAAPRKTVVTGWALVAVIVVLVIGVRHLAQPYRGIVDAGVVVGLGLGLLSLSWLFAKALYRRGKRGP